MMNTCVSHEIISQNNGLRQFSEFILQIKCFFLLSQGLREVLKEFSTTTFSYSLISYSCSTFCTKIILKKKHFSSIPRHEKSQCCNYIIRVSFFVLPVFPLKILLKNSLTKKS